MHIKNNLRKLTMLFITVLLLTGCKSNLKRIDYDTLSTMLDNKETFILEITQDSCSHCEEYAPIFKSTLKENNITAYNLNITYISTSDYDKLKENYNFEGTPTTMFFKDGEEIISSRITGNTTQKKLEKTLKRLNYIK